MKKILLYIGIAIAAIGCATDDTVDITPDSNAVQFSTPNVISRVTSAGEWEGTEAVGISMSGDAEATNVQYKAQSTGAKTTFATTGTDKIIYPRVGVVNFIAYCPYREVDSKDVDYFTVDMSDQSRGSAPFDLLIGTSDSDKGYEDGDVVSFTFAHALAKITFGIGLNGNLESLSTLSVGIKSATNKYTYNLIDGTTSSTSAGETTLYTVVQDDGQTATAELIVYPSDIDSKVVFKVDDRTFEADLKLSDIAASTMYKYELNLGAVVTTFGKPKITEWQKSNISTPEVTDAEAIGAGTPADPFLIYDEMDMRAIGGSEDYIKNSINKGVWGLSSHYKLMKDVELTEEWTPIGIYDSDDATTSFTGVFDGNGKSVSGIKIDTADNYQGLFGSLNSAEIKNLSVAGDIKSTSPLIGGIVGYAYKSTISNCSSSVVVEGNMSVGGIVGKAAEGCTLINCSNSGQVTSSERGGGAYCGGVVGNSYDGNYIINCYNSATVISTVGYVGGVVGYTYSSTITNCYSSGLISTSAASLRGGVVGINVSSTITLCYYDKDIDSSVGGAVAGADTTDAYGLTTSYMKSSSFLTLLNNGAYGLTYSSVAACAWYTGASGYPEFDPSGTAPDAKEYDIAYDDGDDVYLIYTDKGMKAFADLVNGNSNSSDAYYPTEDSGYFNFSSNANTAINGKLVNDIDISVVSGSSWTPIGKSNFYIYAGKFDGDNRLISGLCINASSAFQGLFGHISGAEIKNLGVSGSVTNTGSNQYTAGVVGYSVNSTISDCYNLCKVDGYYWYVGGVVGYNSSSTIVNCYNLGDVSSTNNYLGGVVGGNVGNASVVNCYNQGDVSSSSGYVGGVVGYNSSYNDFYGSVINCYNSGAVGSSSTYAIGGVVGCNNSDCTVTNCYWDGETSAAGTKTTKATTAVGKEYNATSTIATEMTTTAMQNESFVKMLNNGAYEYNNDGTPTIRACKWVYNSGNYPTFDCDDTNPAYTTPDISLVSGVYEINTAVGLNAFGYLVNGAVLNNAVTSGGVNFSTTAKAEIDGELTGDVDLSTICSAVLNANWSPIGNANNNYNGEFDGNGYEVKNIYINGVGAKRGLFGWIGVRAVISNVGVSGTINSSSASGGISYESGGVVAYNQGVIINCYNLANVTSDINVGGVAGYNCTTGSVINCYNRGDIAGSGTGNKNIGGMVGQNQGEVKYGYSDGDVTGDDNFGGVVGYNVGDATISGCYYLQSSSTYCIGSSDSTGNSVTENGGYYYSGSTKLQTLLSGYATTYNNSGSTYTAHSWKDVENQPYPIIDYQN